MYAETACSKAGEGSIDIDIDYGISLTIIYQVLTS